MATNEKCQGHVFEGMCMFSLQVSPGDTVKAKALFLSNDQYLKPTHHSSLGQAHGKLCNLQITFSILKYMI